MARGGVKQKGKTMGLNYYDNVYRYEGKVYCETDLSKELGDEWGGDLYDLYWELKKKGILDERTLYYKRSNEGREPKWYDECEELLADMAEELGLEVFEEH